MPWKPPRATAAGSTTWTTDAYKREVTVEWLNPGDLSQASAAETGIKRIRVVVTYNDQELVTLHAVRTKAWQDPLGD